MRNLAVFIDFENIARSIRQHREDERVDLQALLETLEQQGRLLVRRAYADWVHFKDYRSDVLQHALQPVQVFAARKGASWKNGADINIAVDAMEAAFRCPELTDFVLVSGDSDFLSLVQRLRENGKYVWGIGLRGNTSSFLVKSCDHFLYYDDIAGWTAEDTELRLARPVRQVLIDTVRAMLDRQGLPGMPPPGTPLKASSLCSTLQRHNPGRDDEFQPGGSFESFLRQHEDLLVLAIEPGTGELLLAERNSISGRTLLSLLEQGAALPVEAPTAESAALNQIRAALHVLSAQSDGAAEVSVEDLRAYLQRALPDSSASRLSDQELSRLAGALRDVQPQALSSSPLERADAALSEVQRYIVELRRKRIRHVPVVERRRIIRTLCTIFDAAREKGDPLSLKDAKDRLHQWFEENEPSVSWDHVNNTVYHLFWTYCFDFAPGAGEEELWDRPTRWKGNATDHDAVIRLCDSGLLRMLHETLGTLDPVVATEVLGDRDDSLLPYFQQLCEDVAGPAAVRTLS